jgi:hypothetical protein
MAAKRTKDALVGIRFDAATRRQLEREAEVARRKLSDYLRYLIDTHQERGKK